MVDVFEGYWSPIDKEQTNPWRVLSWLLKNTFVPLNKTRIPATFAKTAFDVGYTAIALLLGLAAAIMVVSSAVRAYQTYVAFAPFDLRGLVLAAIGAYLLVQAGARAWPLFRARANASWWGWLFIVVLAAGGVVLLGTPMQGDRMATWLTGFHEPRLWLLFSAISLRYLLSFAKDFLVDTVGDIEIYTTQDANARFYALREQIIATVGTAVQHVLASRERDGTPTYDKIILAGHSLGTTVLMDVVLALHDLVEAGSIDVEDWRRIRAFVTFGTALEKTRFFFDVRDPTLSPAILRWRHDVYGHIFTPDAMALHGSGPLPPVKPNGIFWMNYWYFTDVVANGISSYVSARDPGDDLTLPAKTAERPICMNAQLASPRTLWPHSHYLSDPTFWHSGDHLGAVAIVAHG